MKLWLAVLLASVSCADSLNVALIYSAATGRLRSIVVPDRDSDLASVKTLVGESSVTVSKSSLLNKSAQAILTGVTGVTPTGDRYAIVDGMGHVIGTVFADPVCGDSAPTGSSLVLSDIAGQGWTFTVVGGFTPPLSPPQSIVIIPTGATVQTK